jgi:hypothetical protein
VKKFYFTVKTQNCQTGLKLPIVVFKEKEKHLSHLLKHKMEINSQALVAYDCNPSYLGSRDQEDQGLKPAQANNS